jgi:natural product biosynthesis luciferase-like monooxygenase protein
MNGRSSSERAWPSFSLLFFASRQAAFTKDTFDLFREASLFADRHGFEAVWVPERHFHAFGGMFPNPSLSGVLLAEITQTIRIRAGSVVLPLHSPIRVAEEWAVVDNLSGGRVDLAFAVGWNPNDFVIAPTHHADRIPRTFDGIETVKALWRGESIVTENGLGEPTEIQIFPAPMQKELNVWMTCSGGRERFEDAGRRGFNVLTALLFQDVEELAEKLAAYRGAREEAGHAGRGHVTLMLHTFLGPDHDAVRDAVREPFKSYLASSVDLWKKNEARFEDMSDRKRNDLLEFAFERYYRKTGLMGTPASCEEMVRAVHDAGADEIACLIDFGVEEHSVLESLEWVDRLRRQEL